MNQNFNKKICMIIILVVFPICIVGCSGKSRTDKQMLEIEDINTISQEMETENEKLNNTMLNLESSEVTEEELIKDSDFVNVEDYISNIYVELKYSTEDNFTGQKIYDFSEAYLRYGTVKKLLCVQNDLQELGLSLKIWDAFRPTEAQFDLWEVCPNSTYVANPNKGFSSHSKGNTIDITIVDSEGNELVMPTEFDNFSKLADRDYDDCTREAAINAKLLEQIMLDNGFKGYFGEWWHFTDLDEYPVEDVFVPIEKSKTSCFLFVLVFNRRM